MAYFTGQNLERKIEEYDLADLDSMIKAIIEGKEQWPPGGYIIPAQPSLLESCRVVLYSILHRYGVKQQFTVRVIPDRECLTVDLKYRAVGKVRYGGIHLAGTGTGTGPGSAASGSKDEDLTGIFKETLE